MQIPEYKSELKKPVRWTCKKCLEVFYFAHKEKKDVLRKELKSIFIPMYFWTITYCTPLHWAESNYCWCFTNKAKTKMAASCKFTSGLWIAIYFWNQGNIPCQRQSIFTRLVYRRNGISKSTIKNIVEVGDTMLNLYAVFKWKSYKAIFLYQSYKKIVPVSKFMLRETNKLA